MPTGLILQQPVVHLWKYSELITVPSGLNLQIPKVHLWDYTKSPDQTLTITLFQLTLLYHQHLCKN